MKTGFLNKAYAARDAAATRKLYDDWSKSYEAEITENQYATPKRCAQALAGCMSDLAAPVLDFGCGTGLSGLAFRAAGFETLDGVDLSSDMIAEAGPKNVYRHLSVIEADQPIDLRHGRYAAIAAVGVIGAGAAPISVLHMLMKTLDRGEKLVFSLNDHALKDPRNEAGLNEWLDCGAAHLVFKEHGPHLPGIDLSSTVYVVEKA